MTHGCWKCGTVTEKDPSSEGSSRQDGERARSNSISHFPDAGARGGGGSQRGFMPPLAEQEYGGTRGRARTTVGVEPKILPADENLYNLTAKARLVYRLGEEGMKGVKGAVCVGCHSVLLQRSTLHLNSLISERSAVEDQLSLLSEPTENPPTDEELDGLESEIEKAEVELENLDRKINEMTVELRGLRRDVATREAAVDEKVRCAESWVAKTQWEADEAASQQNWERYVKSKYAGCKKVTGLAVVFNLKYQEYPATVNGLRLALPETYALYKGPYKSTWNEVNTSLGLLALLVHTMRELLGGVSSRIHFLLSGSCTRLLVHADKGAATTYDLFGSNTSSTTSLDEGIAFLNRSVRSLAHNIRARLPHQVGTSDLYVAEGHNIDWHVHMAKMVHNIKTLLLAVEKKNSKQKEGK